MRGEGRVENNRHWRHLGVEEYLLQLMTFIGDKRRCIVFATIQRRRDRDLSDCGRTERGEVYARAHREWIEACFIADIMFHRHDDYFCEIDGGTSTNSDDQICFCVFSLMGNLGSLLARRVLCNSVKGRCMLVAERSTDILDLIGLGVQGSTGEKEDALCIQPLCLVVQSFRRSF